MELIAALNWRYAAKKMNGAKVPQDKLNNILEAIRLSASSAGLQPYNVVVVENAALRQTIFEKAVPQPQVIEGSHLVIFASWLKLTADDIDEHIQLLADGRGIDVATLQPFANSIKGGLLSRTDEQNAHWAARQAYIALGSGIIGAAVEGVDATPMEGFNPAALDEILGLKEKGLQSVAVLALGYRDAEKDMLAGAKKVRRAKEEFFISYN